MGSSRGEGVLALAPHAPRDPLRRGKVRGVLPLTYLVSVTPSVVRNPTGELATRHRPPEFRPRPLELQC